MTNKHLATYLNDHDAGALTALELLEHLTSAYAGTPVAAFARELHAEIAADRLELEALMAHLDIAKSGVRQASAWLAEKLAELKLRLDDVRAGAFRLFEAAEAVSLGIEGKKLLWVVLSQESENLPSLQLLDYDRLIRRAEDQRRRVEAVRLEAGKAAFIPAQSVASAR
ncbi:MAG: hypothetical protein JWO87_3640 [Phycisphaerales bacterium]|jgi:hypothetical protein|nr:hypothetical protein [Phycisphaerales bacterium]